MTLSGAVVAFTTRSGRQAVRQITAPGELDSTAGVADFRLIDPPRVSPTPVSPNRFILLPVAMLAALASGFLTAFVASQLRPVFHSAAQLRTKPDICRIADHRHRAHC